MTVACCKVLLAMRACVRTSSGPVQYVLEVVDGDTGLCALPHHLPHQLHPSRAFLQYTPLLGSIEDEPTRPTGCCSRDDIFTILPPH